MFFLALPSGSFPGGFPAKIIYIPPPPRSIYSDQTIVTTLIMCDLQLQSFSLFDIEDFSLFKHL
jgi:hypothetical protein